MSKQLEHMAGCQQHRDLGLFPLTASPPGVFIYLPFTCRKRAESRLALNENGDDLNDKKEGKCESMPTALYEWA